MLPCLKLQVTDANFGISTAGSDDDAAAWQLNAHQIMQLPTNPCSTYQEQLEVGCDLDILTIKNVFAIKMHVFAITVLYALFYLAAARAPKLALGWPSRLSTAVVRGARMHMSRS